MDLDKHYSHKENLLFPYLEKYGIYGPTKVMWGVDDNIRRMIKEAKAALSPYNGNSADIGLQLTEIIREVNEMIFKEEIILLPMALDKLTDKFIYIRYFAVRDETGRYMGTLEFAQNIAPIRALEGQKRILSE